MREEPRRIDGRLEATLRIPDGEPRGIVIVAHPLPTHGGTMRNPLIATIARDCADRDLYALRFNFRGTGASDGEFSGGRDEAADVDAATKEATAIAPGKPLLLAGFSFGALMVLRWLASGGQPAAYALLGVPLRGVGATGEERASRPRGPLPPRRDELQASPRAAGAGAPARRSRDAVGVGIGAEQERPQVPDGAFIVQGEHDQFGTAAELRAVLPRARVVEIPDVDHFFVVRRSVDPSATGPTGALRDRYREVAAIVSDQLMRDARLA